LETAIQQARPRTGRPRATIRSPALHAQVVEKLRRLIANGDIAAGERVNELQIAANLGVSRTPVREAVKFLASEGLLELLPGRGARVKRLSRVEILECFEVLGALERHAVESAVRRMTGTERQELGDLHRTMTNAFDAGDARAYFDANQKMHRFFVHAAGNATLASLHEAMTKRARHDRPLTLTSAVRWSASMDEHTKLVAAAASGDAEGAGRAALHHMRRTGEAIAHSVDPALSG
jgi:DNA-binding GntR family transcriptional regulator